MSPDDPGIDPEVLADPLDDEVSPPSSPGDPALEATSTAEPDSEAPTEIVPASRSLVRADPFRRYLFEIRKYPPLTREEERALARRYRDTGDRQALMRLITANLMLVVRVAMSFRRAAKNLLDLVQEGNLGLLAAIERFDPELGVRLPTYAAWWVRAYMIKFMLDNVRLVRVGTTNARRKLLRNLRREKERLEQQGFDVGPKLLAEHFNVSVEDVRDVEAALHSRDVSLDEPVGENQDRVRGDLIADAVQPAVDESVARRELQQRAEAVLDAFRQGLSERDRLLLDSRILNDEPVTLQVLGDRLGITREAVRQAEARLKQRLAGYVREHLGDLGQVRFGPH